MAIYQLGDLVPRIAASAWVAENAQVIGNVTLEDEASIWYSAVLRGDNDHIHIGARSNVQDGSVHGAAAMRAVEPAAAGGGRLRPLLAFSRAQIEAAAGSDRRPSPPALRCAD